jgi:phage terminase large subunit
MNLGSTLQSDLARRIRAALDRADQSTDKFAKYRDDPLAFFREVLHIEPWSRHPSRTDKRSSQLEIIQAAGRIFNLPDKSKRRMTVRSGHGVGKTTLAAGLVWWFEKTRGPGARTFLLSSKGDQAQEAIWRDTRLIWLREKKALGGTMPKRGKTGWTGPEEQQIIILTADKAGKIQGLRAPEMLIVADEAAEIEEGLFVGLDANLSGGGCYFLIGNPTEPEGTFAKSHEPDSEWWKGHISSEDSPNVLERREVVPGLVTYDWVEARRRDWDRPTFAKRVLGEFVLDEAGKPITWAMIKASVARWTKGLWLSPENRVRVLSMGIDPAGYGRDYSVICLTRGLATIGFWRYEKITAAGLIVEARRLLKEHRLDGEVPNIQSDVDGVGAELGYLLGPLAEQLRQTSPKEGFRYHAVKPSLTADRDPVTYERVRDELFASVIAWIEAGGALPPDRERLYVELTAARWHTKPNGQNKKTDKDRIRKLIGRSPDEADALELSVWNAEPWAAARAQRGEPAPAAPRATSDMYEAANRFDMYAAGSPFEPKE